MTSSAFMYVGTYSRPDGPGSGGPESGIHVLRTDPGTGLLRRAEMTATPEPSWLAAHPGGRFLYAVNELTEVEGRPGGAVSAFAVDAATGRLSPLNTRPTAGRLPCHCVTVNDGRALAVSGYLDGTLEVFPIEDDGSLGPAAAVHRHTGSSIHPESQAGPHVHSFNLDPVGRFALVADLGTDRVAVYEFDAQSGALIPRPKRDARVAAGSGPRHLAFHPDGQFVYLVNELAATVVAFGYDGTAGALRELQTVSTVAEGYAGYRAAAEIAVHQDGRFLYVTNRSAPSDGAPAENGARKENGAPAERGEDTIAWFGIDQRTGLLTPLGRVHSGGAVPRTLAVGPDGTRLYVANQRGGNLTTFLIDKRTGALTAAGQVTSVPAPVSLLIAGE